MNTIFSISIGAVLGAVLRHFMMTGISRIWVQSYPLATLIVNVLGSFILGLLVELFALKLSVSQDLKAMLTVGFLSSFTTLSTVALEFALLSSRGQLSTAFLYVTLTMLLSVGAVFLGFYLIRNF
ncbi:MAG: CrcB family protein [Cyanobacteria bacterium REEB446]|nr:CrcB family protein [Cyanobacteria bacterium REEB446]